ncbi:MAG: hypothetical protein ACO1NM_00225 [Sphingobium phenoxybenzoativorans]
MGSTVLRAISPSTPASGSLLMHVQWTPSAIGEAEFSSGLDLDTQTVRVSSGGLWTQADAERSLVVHKRIIREARLRFGSVKAMIDLRDVIRPTLESALWFQSTNSEIYREDDRIAVVVKSSVFKIQLRRALMVGTREAFLSMDAAEMWLQAYSMMNGRVA